MAPEPDVPPPVATGNSVWGVLAVLGLLFLAAFVVFLWQFIGIVQKSGLLARLPGRAYEVSVKPPSSPALSAMKPTLSLEESRRFRDLLEQRKFDELEKAVADVQANFERDPSYEYAIRDLFFWGDRAARRSGSARRLDRSFSSGLRASPRPSALLFRQGLGQPRT